MKPREFTHTFDPPIVSENMQLGESAAVGTGAYLEQLLSVPYLKADFSTQAGVFPLGDWSLQQQSALFSW